MENKKRLNIYYPELDGLRFFAFLLVFIHNAEPILHNSGIKIISEYGWIGVDLFFCISAFLLTRLLTTELESKNRIDIFNYFLRRSFKILPQYLVYIFLVFLFIEHIPGDKENLSVDLIGLITFSYNFLYFYVSPSPILLFIHLWSISFEVQYYLVLPGLVKWFKKNSMLKKERGILFLLIIGFIARAIFIKLRLEHPAIYFIPFTHLDSVIGGITIGLGVFDNTLIGKASKSLLLLTGVFLISLIFFLPNNDVTGWYLMLTYPSIGFGMSLIVYSASKEKKSSSASLLQNKWISYLGKISYGLYLFHVSVFFLVSQFLFINFDYTTDDLSRNYAIVLFIAFVVTTFIASIGYQFIEKPFLRLKNINSP